MTLFLRAPGAEIFRGWNGRHPRSRRGRKGDKTEIRRRIEEHIRKDGTDRTIIMLALLSGVPIDQNGRLAQRPRRFRNAHGGGKYSWGNRGDMLGDDKKK